MLTQRIQSVSGSPTLKFTALAKQLKAEGKEVVNLAGGEPDFDTPDVVKQAAIAAIESGFTKYTPTLGMPPLREAVSNYFKTQRGLNFEPDQVCVTTGAKQALYNALQAIVEAGDEVIIPSPYWVSYPEMVRLAGATPVEVSMSSEDGFHLTAEQLESVCTPKTKCVILNSPSNPTGAVLDRSALEAIGEVVLKHNLWVISDEIYSSLLYVDEAPSIAALSQDLFDRTIIIDGVSKAYSMTGWRMGFLAGPKELIQATGRLQDHSTSCPSSISQKATLAALEQGAPFVQEMLEAFKERRAVLVEHLSSLDQLSFSAPEGAFYCFVDISKTGLKSDEFSERLLKEHLVAAIPGSGFGWDTHVRISFSTDVDQLKEGLSRLTEFLEKLKNEVGV